MIDRRTFVVSGAAFGAAGAAWAGPSANSKSRAIDTINLPADFNGVLAYGKRGEVHHLRCAGFADIEARKPITAKTQFKWGSASKWLTSIAVLRLAEQRRLDLDTPIATYLSEFRRETGSRVLVRHLLSNMSGIPDLLTQQLKNEPELRASTATPAAITARFGGGDLAFVPGTGWDYAALNWVIIAALLERVTGEPLPRLVERLVLRPLRMSSAGFAQVDEPAMPQLAAAYSSIAPPIRKLSPVPPFAAASGNVAGTVQDAMRAAHGAFHGPLLHPASVRALTTVRWSAEEYALGGRVHSLDDSLWAWETGKIGGYRAHIAHRLGRSETIVVFNTTDLAQSTISDWVEAIARA